ncbi:MAG: 16S rRNA (cytosine(967)-C(5))-methyltransferase RsmB [Syntrophales bacterium]|jgi:16S rRNA (cytosine967-C5)-methyltransferase
MTMKTARHMAIEILNRVEEDGAYAEPLLDASFLAHPKTKPPDRRLITEIVYGTLRMRGHLDWIIERLYRGRFDSLELSIRNILRTGLYQLLFTERIPDFAIVDEAVEITKKMHRRGSGLVNAVLRNFIRTKELITYPEAGKDPALSISIVHSHPLWMVRKWIEMFGVEETAALCRANNQVPPLTVRVNTLTTSRERAKEELSKQGFEVKEAAFSSDGLIISSATMPVRETECYALGRVQVQDEASQLISRLVSPKPGENVLDVCAGMGGKTTHLTAIMENRGSILALDISKKKMDDLRKNASRLNAAIVETHVGDARERPGKAFIDSFDKILIDAPCTGLGTLRRNPEIKWRTLPADVEKCSVLQKAILENTAACLKRGGSLIYSTCTITKEENDQVIDDFINRHPDFICIRPPDKINSNLVDDHGYFRTYPHRHRTDGFFGAVLIKGIAEQ